MLYSTLALVTFTKSPWGRNVYCPLPVNKKLRPKQVTKLVKGHSCTKWRSQDSKSCLAPEHIFSACSICCQPFPRRLCLAVSRISVERSRSPPTITPARSPGPSRPPWARGAASWPLSTGHLLPLTRRPLSKIPMHCPFHRPAHEQVTLMRRDYSWLCYFQLLDFVTFRENRKSLQQQLFYTWNKYLK